MSDHNHSTSMAFGSECRDYLTCKRHGGYISDNTLQKIGYVKLDVDLLTAAWGVIANVSGGDWTEQPPEWQEAAKRWRDNFHEVLLAEVSDDE